MEGVWGGPALVWSGIQDAGGLLAHCGVFRQVVRKYHLEMRAVWVSGNILIDVESITKYYERSVVLSLRGDVSSLHQ